MTEELGESTAFGADSPWMATKLLPLVVSMATATVIDKPRGLAHTVEWAKVILIAGVLAVLYGWVALDLAHDWWNDPSLSYGLLVPPLALYFAWIGRKSTLAIPVVPDSRGFLLIVLACLLYLLGKLGAEFFLQRISMVVILAGLIWTFWGRQRLRNLAYPLILLAAMVPLPVIVYNALAAPLQLFASDVATNVARLLGITVYRDGNILQLASISLGVEEACSGLNSLSSLAVGAILLGDLQCTRLRTKIVLFASAIPIAIAVNVLRVAGTAIIADYHAEFAMGFYHSFSGWLVFLLGFAALCGTAKGLALLLEGRRA
jgi:exosortase